MATTRVPSRIISGGTLFAGYHPKDEQAEHEFKILKYLWKYGGEGGIRTHGGRQPPTVFKTVAFNRSATSPNRLSIRAWPTRARGSRISREQTAEAGNIPEIRGKTSVLDTLSLYVNNRQNRPVLQHMQSVRFDYQCRSGMAADVARCLIWGIERFQGQAFRPCVVRVASRQARFVDGCDAWGPGFVMCWSHYVGNRGIGLPHFSMAFRVSLSCGWLVLIALYGHIDQSILDLQATKGACCAAVERWRRRARRASVLLPANGRCLPGGDRYAGSRIGGVLPFPVINGMNGDSSCSGW